MKNIRSIFKKLTILFLAVIFLAACNSNSADGETSDTTTTADTTYPSPDGAEQSMTPSDTSTVPQVPDSALPSVHP